MNLNSTLRYLGVASMLTASSASRAQALNSPGSTEHIGERFTDLLARLDTEKDSTSKRTIVESYLASVKSYGRPVIEDTTVYFIYGGTARRVGVASDLNGWSDSSDTMKRVDGTNFFYLPKSVNEAARFEYKLMVDSIWILDPMNKQQSFGGYGPNSEIWMPHYRPPKEIEYRPDIPHGTLDSLKFRSKLLGRSHPVYIYTPPRYKQSRKKYPSIYVTDGGEYISLGLMLNVLDNLLADKRIEPVIGIFIDPRTDGREARTSTRMFDYSLSDTFVNAVVTELRPRLLKQYRLATTPEQTGIMGASLGGLISTYAAYTHPEIFGLCGSQSPAYWWKERGIFKLIECGPKKQIKFYIDTGTIRDARVEASQMRELLLAKGYEVKYGEYPEGHNWVNWRARLSDILTYFWGRK